MSDYTWDERFRQLWDKAVTQYTTGNRQPASYHNPLLDEIGYTAQELYDFAEDWVKYQEPTFGTALLIAAARRDYFLVVQKGKRTGHTIRMEDLPAKDASVAGLEWLPRVIEKARAKLRGEMPADLMYGCGGDRVFFKKVNVHPADFLRVVWAAHDDNQKIIDYVTR
ncbi:MAG: hypothetical protein PCFJNLEI_02875 [Verrucomicrobiae bacterium]|nr:hypothetical protein [Verrucomicrobiae bacterium]